MLDLGFLPGVETLQPHLRTATMLFSACPAVGPPAPWSSPPHIRAQDPDDQNQTVNTVKQVFTAFMP